MAIVLLPSNKSVVRHIAVTSYKVLEVTGLGILKWHDVNTKFRENRPVG